MSDTQGFELYEPEDADQQEMFHLMKGVAERINKAKDASGNLESDMQMSVAIRLLGDALHKVGRYMLTLHPPTEQQSAFVNQLLGTIGQLLTLVSGATTLAVTIIMPSDEPPPQAPLHTNN